MKHLTNIKKGFTLIELLIVIAIIAILAAIAFVALDPLTRFRDARDSKRWGDSTSILSAIKVDQIDNRGNYLYGVRFYNSPAEATSYGTNYMISSATTTSGCNVSACTQATSSAHCVNLSGLVDEGYLSNLPVSPDGEGTWSDTYTGYYMARSQNGAITVGSCEAENTSSITVSR